MKRIYEYLSILIADHLPRRVVYFAAVRLIAAATTGKYSNTEVPKLAAMDALERWEDKS